MARVGSSGRSARRCPSDRPSRPRNTRPSTSTGRLVSAWLGERRRDRRRLGPRRSALVSATQIGLVEAAHHAGGRHRHADREEPEHQEGACGRAGRARTRGCSSGGRARSAATPAPTGRRSPPGAPATRAAPPSPQRERVEGPRQRAADLAAAAARTRGRTSASARLALRRSASSSVASAPSRAQRRPARRRSAAAPSIAPDLLRRGRREHVEVEAKSASTMIRSNSRSRMMDAKAAEVVRS